MSDTEDLSRFAPTLPRAVREAAARAEQIAREVNVNPDDPDGTVTGATVAESVSPPGSIEAPPFGSGQPSAATTAGDPPATVPTTQNEWEQRYNTLKGKYDTEVPTLRNRVSQLEQLMATLSRAPPPTPEPTRVAAPPPLAEIPQEEVDEWGNPLIERVQDWSYRRVAPEIAALKSEIAQLKGQTGVTQETLNKRAVESVLDREMPGWGEVNVSQGWIDWLQDVDWLSGNKRYDMVNDAYLRGDARRTLAFFRAYQQEQTAVVPSTGTHQGQTEETSAAAIPLETLAAPGRAPMGSQASGGAPARRLWTGAQITAFYDRVKRGLYREREAERARIEQDIFSAQSEGRIVR